MLDWIVNGVVLLVCFVVAFFFLKRRDEEAARREREKALAAAAKEEEEVIEKPYSLKELREYDGSDENKPILLAVNYKVFDVTKGKQFYGKGGSYEALAGRDASRALATMDLSGKSLSSEWDELSDLGADDWRALKDWEQNFSMKYKRVGWLEKEPGKDTENEGADKPVVKEVESVGSNQNEEKISDPPQNGDESQPDEDQPAEESEAHIKDSVEQSHNQTDNQLEGDDQDQQQDQTGQDDQDQQKDQIGQEDQNKDAQDKHQDQNKDQIGQDNQDQQQDEINQSPEAKEVGSQEENQEGV